MGLSAKHDIRYCRKYQEKLLTMQRKFRQAREDNKEEVQILEKNNMTEMIKLKAEQSHNG